jgi:hypothetical protein
MMNYVKAMCVLVSMVFLVTSAIAQGPAGKDSEKRLVNDIMPASTEVLSFTKSATLNTTAIHAVRVQPSVAVTLKINDLGTGWPIAQNAVQEYRIPPNVSSFVFSAPSSAAASPNKVYYQPQ